MLNKKLAVGIPITKETEGGKLVKDTTNMWMHYVDFELELQFSEAKNNVLAWGVSNRNQNGEYLNFGKSGEVIKTGAGQWLAGLADADGAFPGMYLYCVSAPSGFCDDAGRRGEQSVVGPVHGNTADTWTAFDSCAAFLRDHRGMDTGAFWRRPVGNE